MVNKGRARINAALEREDWVADRAANPSAVKWHINDSGKPGRCEATQGRCPFSEDKHFFATDMKDATAHMAQVLEPKVTTAVITNAQAGENPDLDRLDFHELAAKLRTKAADGPINRVEAHLAFMLPGMEKPVTLDRQLGGSTLDGRKRYNTRLHLEGDLGTELTVENVGDELTLSNKSGLPLEQFFQRGGALEVRANARERGQYAIWPGSLDTRVYRAGSPEYLEAAEETRSQITEALGFLEWESSIGDKDSLYTSYDFTRIGHAATMEKWERPFTGGAINYGTDAWQPEHLRGVTLRDPNTHSLKGVRQDRLKSVADGFSVFETDSGAGRASWSMVRSGNGWKISLVGSHGETKEISVATAAEAEAYASAFFQASVARRNLQMAADRLETGAGRQLRAPDLTSPREATRASHASSRTSFLSRVIQESSSHDARVADLRLALAREQATPTPSAHEGQKKGGFGRLRRG